MNSVYWPIRLSTASNKAMIQYHINYIMPTYLFPGWASAVFYSGRNLIGEEVK